MSKTLAERVRELAEQTHAQKYGIGSLESALTAAMLEALERAEQLARNTSIDPSDPNYQYQQGASDTAEQIADAIASLTSELKTQPAKERR